VTDEQQAANQRVLDTIAASVEWLELNSSGREGVEWPLPTGWRIETRYSYLEGVLIASHPDSNEQLRTTNRGRRPDEVDAWFAMLKYCAT